EHLLNFAIAAGVRPEVFQKRLDKSLKSHRIMPSWHPPHRAGAVTPDRDYEALLCALSALPSRAKCRAESQKSRPANFGLYRLRGCSGSVDLTHSGKKSPAWASGAE